MDSNLVFFHLHVDIVVGLEKTYYMVSEDVGVVEVCVNISSPANSECPITSSFDVLLSTVPVNAKGKSTIHIVLQLMTENLYVLEYFDYIPVEHNMTFESCSMRSCVEIFILEDTNVEIDEVFNITLGRTPELDRKIKLDLLDGQIQIMENDRELWHILYIICEYDSFHSTRWCCEFDSNSLQCA